MRVCRQTVEHPFGTIKAWMGATPFRRATRRHRAIQLDVLKESIEPPPHRFRSRHYRDLRRQPPQANRALPHDQQASLCSPDTARTMPAGISTTKRSASCDT
jgi:hypothetical protein